MKFNSPKFLFPFAATISMAAHFLLFQFRYGWYLEAGEYEFLLMGYTACALVIIALWVLFPSRLLVMVIGMMAFIFPPVFREDKFVALDFQFAGFLLLSLLLLAGATQLRRRRKVNK